jgi:hypothetical protein
VAQLQPKCLVFFKLCIQQHFSFFFFRSGLSDIRIDSYRISEDLLYTYPGASEPFIPTFGTCNLTYIYFRVPSQNYFGFEVLTAVVIKSTIFWDISPCSSLKVKRHFGRTYRFHFQGESRRQAELFLSVLFFKPEDGEDMFVRNVGGFSTDCMSYIPEDYTSIILKYLLPYFIFCRNRYTLPRGRQMQHSH